jgi:peptide/nickel transport system permease protein
MIARIMRSVLVAIRSTWHRDPVLVASTGLLVVIVLVCLLVPLALAEPNAQDPINRLQEPSPAHPLGTDGFGRDILSRLLAGGRVTLGVGVLITALSIVLGSIIGLLAGFYRSIAAVLMRLMDALLAFPVLVLAIALVVALGPQTGVLGEVIALTVVCVPYVARVVRARTLELAQRGYVTAARASGVSGVTILWTHVLPNALPTILVQATFVYASTLLADAALSFLGLGVAPPIPTWGNMIAEARPYMISSPQFIIAPGVAIVLAVLAFNVTGDRIRILIDPRARASTLLQRVAAERLAVARRARRGRPGDVG